MSTQDDYTEEAGERCKLIRISDIPEIPQQYTVMIENAYRRGYYQGYHQAVAHDLHNNSSSRWRRALSLLNHKLYAWRYAEHDGKLTPPPILRGS